MLGDRNSQLNSIRFSLAVVPGVFVVLVGLEANANRLENLPDTPPSAGFFITETPSDRSAPTYSLRQTPEL